MRRPSAAGEMVCGDGLEAVLYGFGAVITEKMAYLTGSHADSGASNAFQ